MTWFPVFILIIALVGQVVGAADDSSTPEPPSARSESKPYERSDPIHYGEDPAQTLIVNYYPAAPSRPAMVLVTGWTAGAFKGEQDTPELYEQLALAFVRITHRSVNDFPHPAQIDDVIAGLKYLKEHAARWNVDPDRLALTGHSAGAHLAMLVGFHPDSPDVAAVVEHSAPTDFDPEFMSRINPEMTRLPIFEKLFGTTASDWNCDAIKAKVKEFSPVTYMSPDDPPTLFLARRHGPPPAELDPHYGNHHHLFAEHGYERLREIGGEAELFISEKGIRGNRQADAVEAAFLRKHLRLGHKKPKAPGQSPSNTPAEREAPPDKR